MKCPLHIFFYQGAAEPLLFTLWIKHLGVVVVMVDFLKSSLTLIVCHIATQCAASSCFCLQSLGLSHLTVWNVLKEFWWDVVFPTGIGQVAKATLGQMPNEKMPSAVDGACWSTLNFWGVYLISHSAFSSCSKSTPATVASLQRGWHSSNVASIGHGVGLVEGNALSITDQFHMGVRNTRSKVMVRSHFGCVEEGEGWKWMAICHYYQQT